MVIYQAPTRSRHCSRWDKVPALLELAEQAEPSYAGEVREGTEATVQITLCGLVAYNWGSSSLGLIRW